MEREKTIKKWKGKDWFVILAPEMFKHAPLAETPSTDPKTVMGRVVQTNAAELTGNPTKFYMNLKFRVNRIEGGKAFTDFHGYETVREHIFRVVRKRAEKIRTVKDVETTDGWKMQVIALTILNRNTNNEVKRQVRKVVEENIESSAKNASKDEFVKSIIGGVVQKNIKKAGNKIYPIRFSEIEKIEVLKAGNSENAK
jgi:small subunit ribosomal protein S3Ae